MIAYLEREKIDHAVMTFNKRDQVKQHVIVATEYGHIRLYFKSADEGTDHETLELYNVRPFDDVRFDTFVNSFVYHLVKTKLGSNDLHDMKIVKYNDAQKCEYNPIGTGNPFDPLGYCHNQTHPISSDNYKEKCVDTLGANVYNDHSNGSANGQSIEEHGTSPEDTVDNKTPEYSTTAEDPELAKKYAQEWYIKHCHEFARFNPITNKMDNPLKNMEAILFGHEIDE
jgi:hypothetical protein